MDNTKCRIEDGILQPCPTMDKALQENHRWNGIGYLPLYKHGEVSKSMAVIHSGNLPKNGVAVNYCPFCGASISDHVLSLKEVEKR